MGILVRGENLEKSGQNAHFEKGKLK